MLALRHRSTYSVRTAGHFARFTPDSDFFSPHILYSTHSTLCLFTSHLLLSSFSLCWCFTIVVNPLLTTIAHHIFSSVLAVPQAPPSQFRTRSLSILRYGRVQGGIEWPPASDFQASVRVREDLARAISAPSILPVWIHIDHYFVRSHSSNGYSGSTKDDGGRLYPLLLHAAQ